MELAPNQGWPRLVLFDVGNVLVSLRDWREAVPAQAVALAEVGRGLEDALRELRAADEYRRFERGHASAREFCEAVRRAFSSRLRDEEILLAYGRLLGEEVAGMHALVLDLKRRGVRVAGLSDTTPIHLEALARYPVVRELEALVASCETGRTKPSPETFRHALECLQAPSDEVFFTDDLEENVAGARQAGIRAEVFKGEAPLRTFLGL